MKKYLHWLMVHDWNDFVRNQSFCFLSQGIAGKAGPRGQRGPTVGNSTVCQLIPKRAPHINDLLCSNENSFVYGLHLLVF